MNKFNKILTVFTVLTFFLLYSVSPVFADETAGISNESAGASEEAAAEPDADTPEIIEEIVNIEEVPGAAEETAEDAVDLPAAGDEVVNTIVDIGGATAEEPAAEPAAEPDSGIIEEVVIIDETTGTTVEMPSSEETAVETVTTPAAEGFEILDNAVLNVVVPVSVSVTIDPLELAEKGQIYSNTFMINNDGDTDVLLTFTDIQLTFADETNFLPVAQPFDEGFETTQKAIYMSLNFGREGLPPVVLTDTAATKSGIVIPMSTAGAVTEGTADLQFSFSGCVSAVPNIPWQDNDVRISMNYTLQTVTPVVEELVPIFTEEVVTPESVEVTQGAAEPATEPETAITEGESADPAETTTEDSATADPVVEPTDPEAPAVEPIDPEAPATSDGSTDDVSSDPQDPASGTDATESPPAADPSGGAQQTTDTTSEPST